MALTEGRELTIPDQLHDKARELRAYADRLDDMAAEMEHVDVPPILADIAAISFADTQVGAPEPIAISDLRVRDVIRLTKAHGAFTDQVTVAALDAEAVKQSSLPPLKNGSRCVALRERSGDLDIGWYDPACMVQLVWRPAPLEDAHPTDLDLFRERQHEVENGGL